MGWPRYRHVEIRSGVLGCWAPEEFPFGAVFEDRDLVDLHPFSPEFELGLRSGHFDSATFDLAFREAGQPPGFEAGAGAATADVPETRRASGLSDDAEECSRAGGRSQRAVFNASSRTARTSRSSNGPGNFRHFTGTNGLPACR